MSRSASDGRRYVRHNLSHVIGRVFLGISFLISGIHKIADHQGTQQYMPAMGMTWMTTWFYLGAVAS